MAQLNTAALLGLCAIGINFLLILWLLAQPRRDRIGKSLTAFLLFCLAALMLGNLYRYPQARLFVNFPQFSGASLILTFCLGPILYLYVRRLAGYGQRLNNHLWWLHFLLPVAIALYLIPYYNRSTGMRLFMLMSDRGTSVRSLLYLLSYTQLFVYICLCFQPLQRYEDNIRAQFSNITSISLRWLKLICLGLAVLALLGMISALLRSGAQWRYPVFLVAGFVLSVATAIYAFKHKALPATEPAGEDSSNLTMDENPDQEPVTVDEPAKFNEEKKYSRSGLSSDTASYYLDKLRELEKEHFFLEESLTLRHLAEQLSMSPHHLSQLLNEQLNLSFYDYINQLRINYAKVLLIEDLERPIMDVLFAAGFNTKSTFYSAFKKVEGVTPSQFRKQAQQEATSKPAPSS